MASSRRTVALDEVSQSAAGERPGALDRGRRNTQRRGGLVDVDAAHGGGGGNQEVGPVLPLQLALAEELQERLMHERRGLQPVSLSLAVLRAQPVIHARQQLL